MKLSNGVRVQSSPAHCDGSPPRSRTFTSSFRILRIAHAYFQLRVVGVAHYNWLGVEPEIYTISVIVLQTEQEPGIRPAIEQSFLFSGTSV